jgi:hypothetical protein
VQANTSVYLLSRKLAASNENRSSAFSFRNVRMSTSTEIGAECARIGLPSGRKNEAEVFGWTDQRCTANRQCSGQSHRAMVFVRLQHVLAQAKAGVKERLVVFVRGVEMQ